ncbi:uncharacterized protein MONOS_18339 [Monocercomonoides exilis]|uniref:uncharacterized protein n=1 Tax=Monocercomonoides exilis TaxID=2049356 RepID=UPI003559A84F|nr:hypothetical protein MONOS_18339 [Monocercomonoides exilis]
MDFVSLEALRASTKTNYIVFEDLVKWMRFVLQILNSKHQQGQVQMNLHPKTILVSLSGLIHLSSDGCLSSQYYAPELLLQLELERSAPILTKQNDMWAFGIILFEFALGYDSISGGSTSELLQAIFSRFGNPIRSDFRYVSDELFHSLPFYRGETATPTQHLLCTKPSLFPSETRSLISMIPMQYIEPFCEVLRSTIVYNPDQRIDARQCLELPLFRMFDFGSSSVTRAHITPQPVLVRNQSSLSTPLPPRGVLSTPSRILSSTVPSTNLQTLSSNRTYGRTLQNYATSSISTTPLEMSARCVSTPTHYVPTHSPLRPSTSSSSQTARLPQPSFSITINSPPHSPPIIKVFPSTQSHSSSSSSSSSFIVPTSPLKPPLSPRLHSPPRAAHIPPHRPSSHSSSQTINTPNRQSSSYFRQNVESTSSPSQDFMRSLSAIAGRSHSKHASLSSATPSASQTHPQYSVTFSTHHSSPPHASIPKSNQIHTSPLLSSSANSLPFQSSFSSTVFNVPFASPSSPLPVISSPAPSPLLKSARHSTRVKASPDAFSSQRSSIFDKVREDAF